MLAKPSSSSSEFSIRYGCLFPLASQGPGQLRGWWWPEISKNPNDQYCSHLSGLNWQVVSVETSEIMLDTTENYITAQWCKIAEFVLYLLEDAKDISNIFLRIFKC